MDLEVGIATDVGEIERRVGIAGCLEESTSPVSARGGSRLVSFLTVAFVSASFLLVLQVLRAPLGAGLSKGPSLPS